jgi:hypothetical protein
MNRRLVLIVAYLALVAVPACVSQSTIVNKTALFQTRLIETTKGIGTAFVIDVDKREYWITVKHIFTGIENAPPDAFRTHTVQANLLLPFSHTSVSQELNWWTIRFTTIDPGKDSDILILAPEQPLADVLPDDSLKLESDADPAEETALVPIGGDCEFLGYPYGSGWRANTPLYTLNKESKSSIPGNGNKLPPQTSGWFWSPFVKHCILSGSKSRNGITMFVLDGINNLGFSGGPVVTGRGTSLKVFAVISGFHVEPLEVRSAPEGTQSYISPTSPPQPGQKSKSGTKEIVESNSGLIFAEDITSAIKAIRANPIGPLITGSK